jgi:hypothetical protein
MLSLFLAPLLTVSPVEDLACLADDPGGWIGEAGILLDPRLYSTES